MQINKITQNENIKQSKTQMAKIAFTANYFPSGYFTDREISDARSNMFERGNEWKNRLLGSIRNRYDFFDYFFTQAPEKHVQEVAKVIPDLEAAYYERQEIAANKKNILSKKMIILEQEKQKVKDLLFKKFADLTDLELKGNKVKMPNCIMLVGKSDDLPNELITWTKENSDCNFVKVANADREILQDELWDQLNAAKEIFSKTKKRTLIHVEGFESLINPTMNTFENIDGLKDIMQRCATDFGSTIIFKTKDPSKLNNEAIQPHRVAWIDIKIKSNAERARVAPQKLEKDLVKIKYRLIYHTYRADKNPLNVVNDLIRLYAKDDIKPMGKKYSSYEFKKIEAFLKNILQENKIKSMLPAQYHIVDSERSNQIEKMLKTVISKLKK